MIVRALDTHTAPTVAPISERWRPDRVPAGWQVPAGWLIQSVHRSKTRSRRLTTPTRWRLPAD